MRHCVQYTGGCGIAQKSTTVTLLNSVSHRQHRNYEEELQRDKNPIQEDLEGAEDDDEEEVAVERMSSSLPSSHRRDSSNILLRP